MSAVAVAVARVCLLMLSSPFLPLILYVLRYYYSFLSSLFSPLIPLFLPRPAS